MKKFPATEERKLQTEIDNLMKSKEKLRLVYFLDHIVSKKIRQKLLLLCTRLAVIKRNKIQLCTDNCKCRIIRNLTQGPSRTSQMSSLLIEAAIQGYTSIGCCGSRMLEKPSSSYTRVATMLWAACHVCRFVALKKFQ